tara:strand:+ start:302 stop:649 length:348 start_codon:yes stop_codon:yes gene_type:complete
MLSRDVLKRLDALEAAKLPSDEPIRIIRLVIPHPKTETFGTSLDMSGRKLFFPGDADEGKDVLSAMYWLVYPDARRVILATETNEPDEDALIIPPCPPDTDLAEYAAQQVQRLKE